MSEDRGWIDELPWPSIPAMALSAAERFGAAEAVIDGDRRLDYPELCTEIRRVAAAMMAAGIEPGDRVAVWMPNRLEWVTTALGIQTVGGVLVPINTRFKGAEAAYILSQSRARILVCVTGFLDIDPVAMLADAGGALPSLDRVVVLDGAAPEGTQGWSDFLASGVGIAAADIDARLAAVGPEDVSDHMFTSGTTGNPKGVLMTHAQTLRQYGDWCDMTGLRHGDRYLIVNPFFHIFGYKAGWVACLLRGATILPLAVFEPERVLELVETERVSVLPGAPTIYQVLLDHPTRAGRDLSTLRIAVTGAADIPVSLIGRISDELPFEVLVTGYGLTEAGTATSTRPGDDIETIATTVGTTRDGVELAVVDDEGEPVAVGETGEVVLRGYSVMQGYFEDDEATAEAIDEQRWLHTGDLGVLDERGYLRIVGRKKDMFIVGGFNAYPAEIENFLLGHPSVAQAAVIGIPDERLGEVGMAWVVPVPGAEIDTDELIAWCRERMANFKVPRRIATIAELPVNATGKVEKLRLTEWAADPGSAPTAP